MNDIWKNILISIGASAIIVFFSVIIDSNYLFELLERGLIIILISLFAINTTTTSVVLTKLKEISDETGASFTNAKKQMHISIREQVWLIIVGLLFLILNSSSIITERIPEIQLAIYTVLVAIFFYALMILRDTANAIFVILNYEDENES